MKRIIYKKTKECGYWTVIDFLSESKSLLDLLMRSFNEYRGDIEVEDDGSMVYVQDLLFLNDEGECPTLILSKENYNQIVDQWNKNIENFASYIILSQDNLGWITLEAKNELSKEDFYAIEQDKQAKLEHEQRKSL